MYGLTNYRNNENSIFDPFKDSSSADFFPMICPKTAAAPI